MQVNCLSKQKQNLTINSLLNTLGPKPYLLIKKSVLRDTRKTQYKAPISSKTSKPCLILRAETVLVKTTIRRSNKPTDFVVHFSNFTFFHLVFEDICDNKLPNGIYLVH